MACAAPYIGILLGGLIGSKIGEFLERKSIFCIALLI